MVGAKYIYNNNIKYKYISVIKAVHLQNTQKIKPNCEERHLIDHDCVFASFSLHYCSIL